MTDPSKNTKPPTPEELTAILSRFNIKDVTQKGAGVVIVGGVKPPQKVTAEGTKTEDSVPKV